MLIGVTPFKSSLNASVYNTRVVLNKYHNLDIMSGIIDEIYIDENINLEYTKNKPIEFLYSTVLNAKLNGNLEAGNLQANGFDINYLLVQKRQIDSNIWVDVAKIKPKANIYYYEMLDKYISLNEDYEYSVIPVAQNTYGKRNNGSVVRTHFNGMFLSDKDHNFAFMVNVDYNNITHINPKKVHQTFGSDYPTVVYSNLNYSEFSVQALLITYDELSGRLNLKTNKLHRKEVIKWLNNGKPKVYRDNRGDVKIVTVSDNIVENPVENKEGLNDITINFVEIGDINTELENFGLLPELQGGGNND